MLFRIDHRSGLPIYRQVMDQVRRQIATGVAQAGDQLPTVRDLAARLRVNPMTISKAYSLLEAEGLLERRRGIGLFVADGSASRRQRLRKSLIEPMAEQITVMAAELGLTEEELVTLLRRFYRQHRHNGR